MGRLKKLTRMRETGVLIPLLLLWVVTFAVNNSFFSQMNMTALFRTVSITLLGTLGETFIFACGMMDLSAGSVYGLAGMIVGVAFEYLGLPTPVAILLGLALAWFIGLLNGFIVNRFGAGRRSSPPWARSTSPRILQRGDAGRIHHRLSQRF